MQKVVSAIKSLLDASVSNVNSPIHDIKKVFFGDPIVIPEADLPAIAVQPIASEYTMRWSQYDQKIHTVEIRLIYNQKQYYGKNLWTEVAITTAAFSSSQINFTATGHGLSQGDAVIVSWISPDWFNGTYLVTSVADADHFSVSRTNNPWTYVSGGALKKTDTTTVFAIEDAINKIEAVNVDHDTAALSVCGTIQSNSSLPYSDGALTRYAAEIAKIRSVNYSFAESRWFPTFEVVATVEATVIGDR